MWIDGGVDLEDALAASQAQNEQLQRLVVFQQKNMEALQSTQHGLLEQLRTVTELLEEAREELRRQQQQQQQERQHLEAMIQSQTAKIDALLIRLDEKEPPTPPEDKPSSESSSKPSTTSKAGREKSARNRSRHGRSGPPAHLERDLKEIAVTGNCPHCGHERLHQHDELISEEYDVIRSHIRVRRTVRQVCRCAGCRKRVNAPAPPMPFDKAACTFEMMAFIAYQKVVLFVPLDRLRRDFRIQQVPISPAMIHRWFFRCGELMIPVVQQMRLELLSGDHLRFDGTGLSLVDFDTAGHPVGNGQVIAFCRPDLVIFHPTVSKHGHHIEDFLTIDVDGKSVPWTGTATADAVNIHDQIFKVEGRVESGCNAHGLRKFRDDADCAPLLADEAMGFIGGWYSIEKQAKAAGLSGTSLLSYRQAHAGPIAKRFRSWLDEHLDDLAPQNPIRKALRYYDKHWKPLTAFLHDAAVPLDNNLTERLLRNVALLRKNSLFAGKGVHVEQLCGLLSITQTCRLLNVDPYEYLVWALPKLVAHKDNRGRKIADLTPAAYRRIKAEPEGFS